MLQEIVNLSNSEKAVASSGVPLQESQQFDPVVFFYALLCALQIHSQACGP